MRRKDNRVVDVRLNFGVGKNVMFVRAIEDGPSFLVVALRRTIIAGVTVDGSLDGSLSVAAGM
jgi:hypothetical protein